MDHNIKRKKNGIKKRKHDWRVTKQICLMKSLTLPLGNITFIRTFQVLFPLCIYCCWGTTHSNSIFVSFWKTIRRSYDTNSTFKKWRTIISCSWWPRQIKQTSAQWVNSLTGYLLGSVTIKFTAACWMTFTDTRWLVTNHSIKLN